MPDAPAPARRLYRGGAVYSPADPFATAMLVEGSTIAWVGPDEAAPAWTREGDEVVDLDGALVVPAFVDAHVHTTETGLQRTGLDLSGTSGPDALLDAVAEHARRQRARYGAGALVTGFGWDESAWATDPDGSGPRLPTRAELERAAAGAPVQLSRVDGHSGLVSGALAAAAGLPAREEALVRLEEHAAALEARWAALPAAAAADARRAALRAAAAAGTGTVHEMSGPGFAPAGDLAALAALAGPGTAEQRAAGREALPRVVGWSAQLVADPEAAAAAVAALRVEGVDVGGLGGDLSVDGAIGSRTAAFRADYADAPGVRGVLRLSAAQVHGHLHACTRAQVPAAFHAIGDAALDVLCAALEEVAADLGAAAVASCGHRVEHAVAADADHTAVLARLGVGASVQPAFDAAWGGPEGTYARRLGPARAAALHPFAALAAAGVPLALGSDSPVTPLDGWAGVRAAALHRTAGHAVSVRAAFLAATRGGHRLAGLARAGAGGGAGDGGVLRPGAPATYAVWRAGDLVVQVPDRRVSTWSTDPRSGTPGLPDLTPGAPLPVCLRTAVDGVLVHDALGGDGPSGAPRA
ncbi:amidohydrolase [Kineococcus sp. SYSU DK004]|uniref:amidohydrolase n=1 Tax=Kineococcus sp. SYSU DK004 TaxID=3383125 RepID=UPI003D7D7B08